MAQNRPAAGANVAGAANAAGGARAAQNARPSIMPEVGLRGICSYFYR